MQTEVQWLPEPADSRPPIEARPCLFVPSAAEVELLAALRQQPEASLETAALIFEHWYLREALIRCHGRVQETARALGIARRTIHGKLARHGLEPRDFRTRPRRFRRSG